MIFGGAGTAARPQRRTATTRPSGHARDADMILGDNGNIFASSASTARTRTGFLTFNYDTYARREPIIPRAVPVPRLHAGRRAPTDHRRAPT